MSIDDIIDVDFIRRRGILNSILLEDVLFFIPVSVDLVDLEDFNRLLFMIDF